MQRPRLATGPGGPGGGPSTFIQEAPPCVWCWMGTRLTG